MIRPATPADVPVLVELFSKQHAEMGCAWEIKKDVLGETFTTAIGSPEWLCLIGDGSLLLAVSFESPLGAGRIAQELCLCVVPGKLDELILIFEDWARSRGCRSVALGCEQRHKAFDRLYGRQGYELSESIFSKVM